MPIIIDTKDTTKDIKNQFQSLKQKRRENPKFFSQQLTGTGKGSRGFFSSKSDTINDFQQNKRRLIDSYSLNLLTDRNRDYHLAQEFGNHFYKKTKAKEEHMKSYEHNLTTIIPPILLYQIIEDEHIALSFPKDIGMYDLRNIEKDEFIVQKGEIDKKPTTTYALPIIQAIDIQSKETKDDSLGYVTKQSVTAGQLDAYVLFVTILDDMDKSGDIVFVNNFKIENGTAEGKAVNKLQGVASLYQLRESSRTEFDYDMLEINLEKHNDIIANGCTENHTNGKVVTLRKKSYPLKHIIGDQSLTDILTAQANLIVDDCSEILKDVANTLFKRIKELYAKSHKYIRPNLFEKSVITFVQHIDLLNELDNSLITTNLLAEIFEILKRELDGVININGVARHSLRLLLSQRLHELDEIDNNNGLYEFKPDPQIEQIMNRNPDYSAQQKRIITSTDPLVIGQAGAGSGKSHTLVGRINYLKDQGEDLSKVLVLSFTNVAANNITNRFPSVRSETLANMFHTIYTSTYPAQSLSQPSTVANSIRLLNPKSPYFTTLNSKWTEDVVAGFISNFAIRLEQFDQTGFKRVNLQQELKLLSNLIEGNLELTVAILDAVEQTTLEIEPIIIHHRILENSNALNIPQKYKDLNYIITDESQDISTFEYILLLELTIHHRSQLLIIGDGSQTLYEFRNSDPRYMNALESSDVFTSYKLETNYRSNQEILMYANQFLQIIDANQFAKIQLESVNFSNPTEDSLQEKVIIRDNEVYGGTLKDYIDSVTNYIENDDEFKDWFLDKVRKGEQVALMGWTRKEVIEAGKVLEEILQQNGLSHIKITNIMSNNERPMTILSRFARHKNETLRSLDPTNQTYVVDLERHAEDFVHRVFTRSSVKQKNFYLDMISKNIGDILSSMEWSAWIQDYRANRVNKHQVGSFLIQQLLRAETRKNAMDQFLRKQKETPNYDKCPIILSTIHGTKGLEFTHTVILYNEGKRGSTSQESMRMMFVALSRAKESEFIINSHPATKLRSVSNTQAGMFQTPMNTAMLRALDEITP